MAAGINEHPGNEAGRVTLVTTITSLVPTIFVCIVIVAAFLIKMISAEIAAATLLTALGLGSSISGTVFTTAKKTKTDRADVIWGSPPVTDTHHPPLSDVTALAESGSTVAGGATDTSLADELEADVAAVRGAPEETP